MFEDGAEVWEGEDAFFVDHQIVIVQDVVCATCDPFGVEDVGFAEARVVAVVEEDAEIVEDFDEDGLVFGCRDFGSSAEGLVFFVGDEVVVGAHLFELGFDVEPCFWEEVSDVGNMVNLLVNGVAEFIDSFTCFAGGGDELFDLGIFLF